MMASRPKLSEAKRFNYTNPRPTKTSQTLVKQLSRDGDVILNLGQKRVRQVSPDGQNKRRRLVTELNSVEMKKCGVILEKLMNHKLVVASGLRDYRKIIRCPMDLGTVNLKLHMGAYQNSLQFAKDVRLTFHYARLYNRRGDDLHAMATVLLDLFDKLFDSSNEKFEVEVQREIVEQQKFIRKPLAEITKSQLVSSQQNAEKPVPVEALPKEICKEVAKKTVSEQQQIRTVAANENPQRRREMSDLERDQMGVVLQDFADEYLDEILQIVAMRNSNLTTPDENDEIELDMKALDSETMWDLHKFLRLKLKAGTESMKQSCMYSVTVGSHCLYDHLT